VILRGSGSNQEATLILTPVPHTIYQTTTLYPSGSHLSRPEKSVAKNRRSSSRPPEYRHQSCIARCRSVKMPLPVHRTVRSREGRAMARELPKRRQSQLKPRAAATKLLEDLPQRSRRKRHATDQSVWIHLDRGACRAGGVAGIGGRHVRHLSRDPAADATSSRHSCPADILDHCGAQFQGGGPPCGRPAEDVSKGRAAFGPVTHGVLPGRASSEGLRPVTTGFIPSRFRSRPRPDLFGAIPCAMHNRAGLGFRTRSHGPARPRNRSVDATRPAQGGRPP